MNDKSENLDSFKTLNGEVFYQLFNKEKCKEKVENIKACLNLIKDKDNSDKIVLDLGGGNGSFGVMIRDILKAKKAIIYEPDSSLVETGIKENKEDIENGKLEFINDFMEKALEKEKENKFCFILLKEVIHYSDEIFFSNLIQFSSKYLNGILFISGLIDYSLWKEQLPFPKTGNETLKNTKFTITHCNNILKKENLYKFQFHSELIYSDLSFDEYSSFVLNKGWSNLKDCSENELKECVDEHLLKAKKDGKLTIPFNKEYGFLHVEFNI